MKLINIYLLLIASKGPHLCLQKGITTDSKIPIIQPLLILRNYSINIYILFVNEKDLGNHFREILKGFDW